MPSLIFLILCNSFNTYSVSSYNSYASEVVNLLYIFVDNAGNIGNKSYIEMKVKFIDSIKVLFLI